MNIASGEFGRDSPTYGFVYPGTGEPGAVAMRSSVGFDGNSVVSQVAYEPTPRSALLHFAVAEDGWHGRLRFHRPAGVGIPRRYSHRRERRRSVAANEHRSAVHAFRIRASHPTIHRRPA
jgi:hypothetical protein